jgi:DNA-binding Lrp family transcriptional regulator
MLGATLLEMTEHLSTRHWARFDEPAAATFLIDLRDHGILAPFFEGPISVAEAAERLGLPFQTVYYIVRRAAGFGILVVAEELRRAGRAVKRYQTAGEGLFVPFAATDAATLEELVRTSNASYDAELVRGQVDALWRRVGDPERWGFRIFRHRDGSVHVDLAPEEAPDDFDLHHHLMGGGGVAVLSYWVQLALAPEVAEALHRELADLVERYRGLAADDDEGAVRHVVRVAVAPLSERARSGRRADAP